jgi:hypothetical protein
MLLAAYWLPVVSIIVLPLIAYFIVTIIYAFKTGGHPTPLIVLILGIILAVLLPTPPQYEIRIFNSHRTNYENLVNLAREHRLEHSQRCNIDRSYEPPVEYKQLSADCILVDYQPFFSVQFAPRIYTEQIVYIEDPNRIEDVMGCNIPQDGDYHKQLDKNWYYCSMHPSP